jgi:hypothetical protein
MRITGVKFPDVCARCVAAPPTETWLIGGIDYEKAPDGRRVYLERRVDIPVCANCHAALKNSRWWSILCALPIGPLAGVWLHTLWTVPQKSQTAWIGFCVIAGLMGIFMAEAVIRILFFGKDDRFAYYRFDELMFANPEYNRIFQEMNPPLAPATITPYWSKDH